MTERQMRATGMMKTQTPKQIERARTACPRGERGATTPFVSYFKTHKQTLSLVHHLLPNTTRSPEPRKTNHRLTETEIPCCLMCIFFFFKVKPNATKQNSLSYTQVWFALNVETVCSEKYMSVAVKIMARKNQTQNTFYDQMVKNEREHKRKPHTHQRLRRLLSSFRQRLQPAAQRVCQIATTEEREQCETVSTH